MTPAQAEAETYTTQWKVPNISLIRIYPTIDVEIEYNPGDTTMQVSYRCGSIEVNPHSADAGGAFFDGIAFSTPPCPPSLFPGCNVIANGAVVPTEAEIAPATDFTNWGKEQLVGWLAERNTSAAAYWCSGGIFTNGNQWKTYTYDISGYPAGASPVLLYGGVRHIPPTTEIPGAYCASRVDYFTTLTAESLGMSVKVAPKIILSSTEGGTSSHTGEKYYEYNTASDTYTWTPNPGYRIKDIKIDGVSQGPISSYSFSKVVADHTISAEFEKIRVNLTCLPGAEDAIGEMIPIQADALTDATVPECSYTYRGRRFVSWNTQADGSGTTYAPGNVLRFEEQDITLYAQWEDIPHTVTWTDSLTGEVFHTETVLDTFPAPIPPLPEHEGYKAVLPFTEEELSNITEDKNYSVSYELIPYTIGVEFISKDTGKPISPPQSHTQPFRTMLSIDVHIKEIYTLESDMISVTDTDTGEAIPSESVFETTLDNFGHVSEMTCRSTPARNLTVKLLYDCSIKMPETGRSGMVILLTLGTVIVGTYVTCRASRYRRKQ